jgi:flagellar assembly protein FliH
VARLVNNMSSRLIRDSGSLSQAMPWTTVDGNAGAAGRSAPGDSQGHSASQQTQTAAQIEQRIREARDAGRKEGEAAVRQAAQAEIQKVLQNLGGAIQQVVDLRPRLRMEAESDVVRLAIAIAKRVVHRELSVDPDTIVGLVRVGLEKLRQQEVTKVSVHPDHQAAIKGCLAGSSSASQVEVKGDPTRERGTIVFETNRGNLDISIETQLREIERGLTDRLRGQGV